MGTASSAPPLLTIVIATFVNDPIEPDVPLTVAMPDVKETEPKSARGKMLEELEGASAIHSADDSSAPLTLPDVLNVFPVEVSVRVTVKFPLPVDLTSAEMTSPGLIVRLLMRTDARG